MILFRTEATRTIGTGHLMRCLALAEICMEHSKKAIFVMGKCPASLATRLAAAGIKIMRLKNGADVTELLTLLKQLQPAGIVIDGYQFDEQYRQSLYSFGLPVLAMDDGTSRHFLHADIIVNVSPLASAANYKTIAANARLLLGPGYAPLRSEFRQCKNTAEVILPDEQYVLITFGGSDLLSLTLPVIEALLNKLPKWVVLDVVVGGVAPGEDRIDQLALDNVNRIQLHKNTSRMAELMRRSTLAIAAAGSTLWELAYLTIPTIAVVIADNQAVMLKPPLNEWFGTVDARTDTKDAVNQITTASHALWKDGAARKDRRTVLNQIRVGEKAATICEIFDETFTRPT